MHAFFDFSSLPDDHSAAQSLRRIAIRARLRGPAATAGPAADRVRDAPRDWRSLLDRYLEGDGIETDALIADLRTAIAHGTFFPILPVAPLTGAGVDDLLGLIERAFPDPTIHPLPAVTTPAASCPSVCGNSTL